MLRVIKKRQNVMTSATRLLEASNLTPFEVLVIYSQNNTLISLRSSLFCTSSFKVLYKLNGFPSFFMNFNFTLIKIWLVYLYLTNMNMSPTFPGVIEISNHIGKRRLESSQLDLINSRFDLTSCESFAQTRREKQSSS